ncbi:hypothetical protein [Ruegeria sp.]|uniref:hypothetical protein n=1 Tax=Ruegeria sp. TaxID=1879320 RepID=UPI003AFF61C7
MSNHPDTPALPVPAPPAHLVALDGTQMVAGLTWEIASGPELPVFGAGAAPILRLPTRRAELTGTHTDLRDGARITSLLLAMAASLRRRAPKDARGIWLFIAELPGPVGDRPIWIGLADLSAAQDEDSGAGPGTLPRAGREECFRDADAALRAVQRHLATTEIAGVAGRWICRQNTGHNDTGHNDTGQNNTGHHHILQALAQIAPALPVHDLEPDAVVAEGLVCFAARPQVPLTLLGGLGAGAALLLAAFLVLPLLQDAFRAAPPPPPEMVSITIAPHAFATTCRAALEKWWPRVIGWETGSRGCALANHLPATLDLPDPGGQTRVFEPLVIWAQFTPVRDRNPVLARSAAERVLKSWHHEARLDPGSLTLWQVETLPVAQADPTLQAAPALKDAAEQLAGAWAEAPDAVAAREGAVSITAPPGISRADLFARSAGVPGFFPIRFVQSGSRWGTLDLAPIPSKPVPASLLDPNRSEGTQ